MRFPSEEHRTPWLIDFLNIDLGTLTDGQRLGMATDASAFPEGWSSDDPPTVETLPELQACLRDGWNSLLRGEWWMVPGSVRYGVPMLGFGKGRLIRGNREGAFQDLFIASAIDEISEAWKRLLRCPRCGAVFLKAGKQIYCSPRCSQRAQWEKFKARRPKRDYRAERERAAQKRIGECAGIGERVKVRLGKRRNT